MATNQVFGDKTSELTEMLEEAVNVHQAIHDCSSDRTFSCAEELVLRFGMAFRPPEFVSGPSRRLTDDRFSATARFALGEGLVYVEGYARLPGIPTPIHHAWCVQQGTDTAIDLTTANLDDYIGIPFRHEAVRGLCEGATDSRLLSNDEEKCPLLQMSRLEILSLIEPL